MRNSETNMEHYRNEILEILKTDNGLAMVGGELVPCDDIRCDVCEFETAESPHCDRNMVLWLMEDYKPEITLTAREKGFVDCMEGGYIARDADGCLCWFNDMPVRSGEMWDVYTSEKWLFLNEKNFSFITWNDKEPWEVSRLRELKVKDE